MLNLNRASVKKALGSKSTLSVLAVVLLWTYAFHLQWVKKQFPFLVTAQLRFHQLLSHMDPMKHRAKEVAVIEIDDDTYWTPPFSGTCPTNRKALADLATAVANSGAKAIAIDFRLTSPSDTPGDDPTRGDQNQYLLDTLWEIAARKIPVILTYFLVDNGHDGWKKQANIFEDASLPPGISLGFINLPRDKRQIPLQMTAEDWNGDSPRAVDSFALKIVDAVERKAQITPPTLQNGTILAAEMRNEYVYGTFFKPKAFCRVSAKRVLNGEKFCQDRIVIIGANWHEAAKGVGRPIEDYPSPVGSLPGLYLHANYVESLLEDHFWPEVPIWIGEPCDLLIGMLLYILVASCDGIGGRILVSLVFLIPLCLSYLFIANLGLYFDCVLPLSLCFVHLGYDFVRDYLKLKWGGAPANVAGASAQS